MIALLDTSDDEPAAGAAAAAAGLPWSAWEDALLQQGLEVRSEPRLGGLRLGQDVYRSQFTGATALLALAC